MTASVSALRTRDPVMAPRSIEPEELVRAGIQSDPESPEGAFRRARALVRHGRYKEARSLLYPHARCASPELRPRIAELLGVCAMSTSGDWRGLFEAALRGYVELGNDHARGRVRRHLGEMFLLTGDFDLADRNLEQSSALLRQTGDLRRASLAESTRACVSLRRGEIKVALARVDRALKELMPLGRARDEGLVRLDRARILAHLGDGTGCAKELVCAERMLARSGNRNDHVRARLARAETLLILDDTPRARAGLRRLLAEVTEMEDLVTRAHVHGLLGRASAGDELPAARRHLMRAKHLYQRLGSPWGVARCELALASVEHRLGLAVGGRLRGLASAQVEPWPSFHAELRTVQAESVAETNPDLARRLLFESRQFAVQNGDRSFTRRVDRSLRTLGLVASDDLTPMEIERTDRLVHSGHSVVTRLGAVPPGGPQTLDDDTDRDVLQPVASREATRVDRWASSSSRPTPLEPVPAAGGARR